MSLRQLRSCQENTQAYWLAKSALGIRGCKVCVHVAVIYIYDCVEELQATIHHCFIATTNKERERERERERLNQWNLVDIRIFHIQC